MVLKLETQITFIYRATYFSVYLRHLLHARHRHSADRKKQTKKRVLKERKSNEGDEGEEAQWMTPKQINNRQANKNRETTGTINVSETADHDRVRMQPRARSAKVMVSE